MGVGAPPSRACHGYVLRKQLPSTGDNVVACRLMMSVAGALADKATAKVGRHAFETVRQPDPDMETVRHHAHIRGWKEVQEEYRVCAITGQTSTPQTPDHPGFERVRLCMVCGGGSEPGRDE